MSFWKNLLHKKKKKVGCPVCFEKNTIGFGVENLESNYDSKIEFTEKIGDTQIYKCSMCNSFFFREGDMYEKFVNGQIEMLRKFDEQELLLTNKLKSKINSIGLSNDWNMVKLAPAKVKLKNGDYLDFATIRISTKPPIGYYFDHFSRIIFIDEIETIEASEFAVSQEIREKARNAKEMRMGFYPTAVKGKNGETVILNGQVLFFKNAFIKGTDLKLANESWSPNDQNIFGDEIDNKILVIAKK